MHQLKIVKPELLHSVLQALVLEFGSGHKAAGALGIGQWTFSRLLNGTSSSMTVETFDAIEGMLEPRFFPTDSNESPRVEVQALPRSGLIFEFWAAMGVNDYRVR